MFGIYRTILALFVVEQHMRSRLIIGEYAVFGFFILSGYLMTFIMHSTYGYTFQGIKAFLVNRFLRIYPLYWLACLLSIALILTAGGANMMEFKKEIQIPTTFPEILQNIFIVMTVRSPVRLVPPAWALTTELFYYILIGVGISRNKTSTLVWLVLSVGYVILIKFLGLGWYYRYFFVAAGSLPFATGALIYHYREQIGNISLIRFKFLPIILLVLVVVNFVIGLRLGTLKSYNLYINYALQAAIVASLSTKNVAAFVTPAWDKFIGNLSYPIYLLHYQAGFIAFLLGFGNRGELGFLFATVIVLFFISWLAAALSEAFIERLRAGVKNGLKPASMKPEISA